MVASKDIAVSIIVPAHNEEGNLGPLSDSILDMAKRHGLNLELILVDDNSSDNTPQLVDSLAKKYTNIKAVHRRGKGGMGYSLCEGTRHARGRFIVWVMGDRSDDLKTIPKMIAKLESGYDMVFGSRYIRGGSSGDLDPSKAMASSGYTRLARFVFGFKVHDITNAFRAFRREVFAKVRITSGDFAISPEFAIKAHLKGFRLGEVPTIYSNRVFGKTKFKMLKMGIRYLSLLRYKLTYR